MCPTSASTATCDAATGRRPLHGCADSYNLAFTIDEVTDYIKAHGEPHARTANWTGCLSPSAAAPTRRRCVEKGGWTGNHEATAQEC